MLYGREKTKMEYILSIFVIILEYMSLKNFGDTFLHPSKTLKPYIVSSIYILTVFSLVNFPLEGNNSFKFVIILTIIIFTFVIVYTDKILSKILISIIAYSLLYAFDYIYILLFFELFDVDYTILSTLPSAYIVLSVTSKFTLYIISHITKNSFNNRNLNIFDKKYFYLSIAFPIFSFITLIILFSITISSSITSYWIVIDVFGIIIANIFILSILDKLSLDSKVNQEKIILEQRLKSELENLEAIKNMYSQQRKLTHDFSNHISLIHNLAQNENSHSVIEYTKTLLSNISENAMIIDTHNITIDAIINQKFLKAQQHGISMRFEINDLSNFPLNSNELVIVLGNALDNAIHAASKVYDKTIKVKILKNETSSIISIINTSEPVEIINNSIIVQQEPDLLHGFGVSNIKSALSKYNHIFAINYSSGWFQLSIIINKN